MCVKKINISRLGKLEPVLQFLNEPIYGIGFFAKQITLSCNVSRMLAAPLSNFSWKRGKWRRAGRGDY